MKKQQRNYTLLLIKDDSSSVKKISFNQKKLHWTLFLGLVFLMIFSFFLTDYVNIQVDHFKMSQMTKENQIMTQKFSKLELQVKNLEEQVQQAQQFSKKIQLITNHNLTEGLNKSQNIGKIHSNSVIVALSTPSPSTKSRSPATAKTAYKPSSFSSSGELELRITKLKGRTELTKQNTWTLYSKLLEKQELLDNTPSILPSRGWISSHFGYRNESVYSDHEPYFHRGMDVAASEGSEVYATADGKVIFAGYDDSGFGNLIIIDHGYGLETYYAHLSEINTEIGAKVNRWNQIGAVGNTGKSTGPHLHYEVRIYGMPVNPTNYILDSSEVISLSSGPHSH